MLGSIAPASPSTSNGWQFNLQLYMYANICVGEQNYVSVAKYM